MAAWSPPLAASCVALFVLGCNAIFGVDDLHYTPRAGGGDGATGGAGGLSSGAGGLGTSATGGGGGGDGAKGGSGPAEICDNGLDDDGDGLVDCADAACPGVSCLPTVPPTWEGPLVVSISVVSSTEPCQGAWDELAYLGASVYAAEPAECAACACGDVQNASCSPVRVYFYPQSNCLGDPEYTQLSTQSASCQSFSSSNQLSAGVSSSEGSGGSCAAQGGGVDSMPAIERDFIAVCRQSTPTCIDGCAPEVPAGFVSVACVGKSGEEACPAGFGAPFVVYQSLSDTRSCSACGCGSPTVTCDGAVQIHEGITCATGFETIAYGSCADTTNDPDAFVDLAPTPSGGCPPVGGAPIGNAIKQSPVTICCPE